MSRIKKLTIENFFGKYIIHPTRKSLSQRDRVIATLASLALGLCTLFSLHFGVAAARGGYKFYKWIKEDREIISEDQEHVSDLAKRILNGNKPHPREVLNDYAKALAEKAKEHPGPFHVKGLPNIGNTCYMNAALQNLEALILSQPAGVMLLKSDLSFLPNESYQEIEKRLLHAFAPIQEDENELRIGIKWSLLVLLQVKQFGTSEQLIRALKAHRDYFFNTEENDFTEQNRIMQLDTADYMRLILDKLGLHFQVNEICQKVDEPESITHATHTFLDVHPLFMPEEPDSFEGLLKKAFLPFKTESGSVNAIKLSGEPPENMVIRIVRNIFEPVESFLCVTEMRPENHEGREILVPTIQRKKLPAATMQAKNNAWIDFTKTIQEGLDLRDYFDEPKEARYKVIGVNVHLGESVDAGHYVSYVLSEERWYLLNDNQEPQICDLDDMMLGMAALVTLAKLPKQALLTED